jgi:hypothetical protein
MGKVTLTKKEYSELMEIKEKLDKILREKKRATSSKENNFLEAFRILKRSFKGDSLDYIAKLRKEWRK